MDFHVCLRPPAHWMNVLLVVASTTFFVGCSAFGGADNTKFTADLQTVHDAVQFAIDEAQRSGIWEKTSAEQVHWQAACKNLTSAAESSCSASSRAAEDMCLDACRSGGCSPFVQKLCQDAMDGKSADAVCGVPGIAGKRSTWCSAASSCDADQAAAKKACTALKTVLLPRPKLATLTLSVEESRGANGSVTLLVVSFGGGSTTTTANTVTSTLKPRPRDKDYGVATLPPLPTATDVSPEAKAMASDLSELIASAVRSANSSYGPPPLPASAAVIGVRPPLALNELKVEFALTLDKNGKLGLDKSWASRGIGVEAGASSGIKRSNKLEIVYSNSDD